MKLFITILSFILSGFVYVLVAPTLYAATCSVDTKIYVQTNSNPAICYSANDPLCNPGFNTVGGAGTGLQVRCPGDTTNPFPTANLCVVKINGKCFAGQGPSGYDTPGCTPASQTQLTQCPTPMNMTTQVNGSDGKGLDGVTLTVTYEDAPPGNNGGKVTIATTSASGTAIVSGKLYSGDHFMIVPSKQGCTFNPPQIGSTNNLGDQEMNTLFSCGTDLENGTSRPPCTFTSSDCASPTTTTTTTTSNTQQQFNVTDTTIGDAEVSTQQTVAVIGVIAGAGLLINSLIGRKGKG